MDILSVTCSCQKAPAGSHPKIASLTCLSGTETGITFSNTVNETNWLNILTYFYFYNGGGVAAGDINDDGLPDLYFTANMGSNRLYLNKGNLKFEDITEKSGTGTQNEWSTGVTMVDFNGDGKLDIYVCQVDGVAGLHGQNKLFINHGDLTFSEEAAKYHLDFRGHATQAACFDYDRDGDLDCYLLNHSLKNPHQYVPAQTARQQFDPASGDVLYKNMGSAFTDITDLAHIYHSSIGYGLGIAIEDLNGDHWPDIYVGNDFYENDYLYLNQHDGTFKEVIHEAVGHTSNFTMGVATADINGDNLPDILSLDMKPEDEFNYKSSGGWESLNLYKFKRTFGYAPQSPKNALQVNQGAQGSL
ncbi:MAG TPA: VCBS repeat-containing protein, partial [Saprospiraceae bacterium]|nr:VCBS repeat-containing protein [Saprospiraceae bacterium]